jgi:hypothetical protein
MASTEEMESTIQKVQELTARTRDTCLWFMREDFVPRTITEALDCLDKIQRHGDRDTYIEARRLGKWLSQASSGTFSR